MNQDLAVTFCYVTAATNAANGFATAVNNMKNLKIG